MISPQARQQSRRSVLLPVLFFAPPLVSTPAKLGRGLRTSQALDASAISPDRRAQARSVLTRLPVWVNCTHYRAAALLSALSQLAESIRVAKRFRVVPISRLSVRLSAYCEIGRVPELGVNLNGRDFHSELAAKLAGEKAFPAARQLPFFIRSCGTGLVPPFQYFPRVFCFDQTRALSIR